MEVGGYKILCKCFHHYLPPIHFLHCLSTLIPCMASTWLLLLRRGLLSSAKLSYDGLVSVCRKKHYSIYYEDSRTSFNGVCALLFTYYLPIHVNYCWWETWKQIGGVTRKEEVLEGVSTLLLHKQMGTFTWMDAETLPNILLDVEPALPPLSQHG